MPKLPNAALLLTVLLLVPAAVSAQSTITGVVSDTSGAVLPGVTVEAASEALIEKVRTAVTDGSGRYRIVDLRPGTYKVTFTLTGFNTFVRDGLELPAEFVSTVNTEMRVGQLEETVTVTGESPVVDVQSARRQRQLNNELIEALPAAQGFAAIATLMPSFIISGGGNNNVQLNTGMIVFGGRGGRGNEGIAQTDGIGTGAAINGGGVSGYGRLDTSQEVVMTSTGGLGDVEVGGPIVNLVPRSGGNSFENRFQGSGLTGGMQGSNYSQALKDAGLRTPAKTRYQWDTSLSNSGPVMRDRLWFFYATRYQGSANTVPGMFYNKNAGDPTKWLYEPDFNRPAQNSDAGTFTPTLRLTWQVAPQHKVGLFWDAGGFKINRRNYPSVGTATNAPETGTIQPGNGSSRLQQAKWTATMTNRLLLEAGLGTYQQNWNGREAPGNNRDLIRVVEQCARGCPNNGNIAGLTYRAANWNADWMSPNRAYASATYVTGAHNMKAGYQGVLHINKSFPHTNNHNLQYRFNNGVPDQLTQNLFPYRTEERTRYDALYVQDQWTRGRMTLQGALRYDHAWSYYPAQQIGPTRFLPGGLSIPDTKGVLGYHDISPRMGVAYDIFGNGKTAVKVHTGRYLEAAVNGNGNYSELRPINRIANSTTRSWTDANGNFAADCDLLSGLAQDLRGSGGDVCGAWSSSTFGKEVPVLSYDEQILKGWYNRPADWQVTATVQHEVLPRLSVEAGYTRRWLQNFTVTDNLAVSPSDFTKFSITAPLDPRLPGGGGYLVEGLYNVNPDKFGQTNNSRTYAPAYGNVSQVYNGVDVNISARLRNGLQVQGGTSTGQSVVDSCEVRDKLPEQVSTGASSQGGIAYNPVNPYCHNAPGFTTRATAAGSYMVPQIDVQLAFTFTSSPGVPLQANWVVTNDIARPSLGRNLAAAGGTVTVNLLEPGQMRSPRVNILDFRVGKILRFGSRRANIAVDLYNVLNLDTVITQNETFVPGGQWLVPNEVLTARTAKLTLQYDF
ncbi:MAG TPA: carboxypeptidase regulatory-like domain-containing protein [Vicinamibacterales bacterium]|nr:carboxypeptidase regulatory-like domain-containing protein [Vicinamibacterales bacterium]